MSLKIKNGKSAGHKVEATEKEDGKRPNRA